MKVVKIMVVDSKTVVRQLKLLKKKSARMRLAGEKWDRDWKTLIAISMSAQSRDEVTIKIATLLFEKYPTLEALSKAKYKDVLEIFKSLNYNKSKAKNVIECAKQLAGDFRGKVPIEIDKLLTLRGVGRKTANVFLAEKGFAAIGVDTHLAYISQQLGWTKHKNPDKIEQDLLALFPRTYWGKINPTLVRFGKTYVGRKKKSKLLKEIKSI